MFIERFHVECSGCGKLWPEGIGYGAKNTLNYDIPKDWKLGKNWDEDMDFCPVCVSNGEMERVVEEEKACDLARIRKEHYLK